MSRSAHEDVSDQPCPALAGWAAGVVFVGVVVPAPESASWSPGGAVCSGRLQPTWMSAWDGRHVAAAGDVALTIGGSPVSVMDIHRAALFICTPLSMMLTGKQLRCSSHLLGAVPHPPRGSHMLLLSSEARANRPRH
jgi:hypothetical protein